MLGIPPEYIATTARQVHLLVTYHGGSEHEGSNFAGPPPSTAWALAHATYPGLRGHLPRQGVAAAEQNGLMPQVRSRKHREQIAQVHCPRTRANNVSLGGTK